MYLSFQFNLVCDDQWKQPLTSFIYFLGGLSACLVSGLISDRYCSTVSNSLKLIQRSATLHGKKKCTANTYITNWRVCLLKDGFKVYGKCRNLHNVNTVPIQKCQTSTVSHEHWWPSCKLPTITASFTMWHCCLNRRPCMLMLWLTPLCYISISGLAGSLYCLGPTPCWASSAALWPSHHPGPSLQRSSSWWAWVRLPATSPSLYWVWILRYHHFFFLSLFPLSCCRSSLKFDHLTSVLVGVSWVLKWWKVFVLSCWRVECELEWQPVKKCSLGALLGLCWTQSFLHRFRGPDRSDQTSFLQPVLAFLLCAWYGAAGCYCLPRHKLETSVTDPGCAGPGLYPPLVVRWAQYTFNEI